jgi:hypothetical protein
MLFFETVKKYKNSDDFFIFFTVFSVEQSEAELQILSRNSHHDVIIVSFEVIEEI